MQLNSTRQSLKNRIVAVIGITVVAFGLFLPTNLLRPPSERTFLGPLAYSSQIDKNSVPVSSAKLKQKSEIDFSLKMELTPFERPRRYSYIFSGPEPGMNDVALSINQYGTLFLELPIFTDTGTTKAILAISDPTEPGKKVKFEFDYSANFKSLRITLDSKDVSPVDVNTNQPVTADMFALPHLNFMIGGIAAHRFNGSVANLYVSYGELRNAFDLRNLRVFMFLLGLSFILWGLREESTQKLVSTTRARWQQRRTP
jgi:hypothetical protein